MTIKGIFIHAGRLSLTSLFSCRILIFILATMQWSTLPLLSLLSLLPSLLSAHVLPRSSPPPPPPGHSPSPTFAEVTVFTPPTNYSNPRVLYARTALLPDNTLLATWENYSPQPPLVYFPIYRSTDSGLTWHEISRVTDQVNGWGLRYQPFLYVLPEPLAGFPAGTVLCAGNSIPANLSNTQIDLYASVDQGYTWKFVSHVAAGGEAVPDDGLTPVWEPFMMLYEQQLVVFYSDQRDPAYGQKLVHQTSSNLKSWTAPVDDVAYATYTDRPGMTTVAQLPNGKFIMTYEFGGGPTSSTAYEFPAYYRIADSPLLFNSSTGYPIITPNGTQPTSSPYVVWSPVGGPDGTIAVSTGTYSPIFVNQALGKLDAWREVATPESVSYSRHLRVLRNPDRLLIMGAGALPPATDNTVTVSVIDLLESIAASG